MHTLVYPLSGNAVTLHINRRAKKNIILRPHGKAACTSAFPLGCHRAVCNSGCAPTNRCWHKCWQKQPAHRQHRKIRCPNGFGGTARKRRSSSKAAQHKFGTAKAVCTCRMPPLPPCSNGFGSRQGNTYCPNSPRTPKHGKSSLHALP